MFHVITVNIKESQSCSTSYSKVAKISAIYMNIYIFHGRNCRAA